MKIDFTIEQIGILDKAIQQLPYYVAAPLIAHINKQISERQEAMDKPLDAAKIQRQFDEAVDAKDMPSGANR